MAEPADQAETVQLPSAFLEPPDKQHLLVEFEQLGVTGVIVTLVGVGLLEAAQLVTRRVGARIDHYGFGSGFARRLGGGLAGRRSGQARSPCRATTVMRLRPFARAATPAGIGPASSATQRGDCAREPRRFDYFARSSAQGRAMTISSGCATLRSRRSSSPTRSGSACRGSSKSTRLRNSARRA